MTKYLVFIGLFITSLISLGFPGCDGAQTPDDPNTDYTRVPMLSTVPREGFIPEPGFNGPENLSFIDNGQPYYNGAYVIEAKANQIHIGLRVTNEGDEDIAFLVLMMFTSDAKKFVLGKISNWDFLWPNIHVPTPAMLDEAIMPEPVYYGNGELDPYPGFVNYIPIGPLEKGKSFDYDAYLGVGEGLLMHFEATGMLGDEAEKRWAIPLAKSGTTLVVNPAVSMLTKNSAIKKSKRPAKDYKIVPRPSTR